MPKKATKTKPVKKVAKPKSISGHRRPAENPKKAATASDPTAPLESSKSPPPVAPSTNSNDSCVVKTRQEVVNELKQRIGKGSVRSLNDWLKMGCPGTPGAYNVDEIEAWIRENIGTEQQEGEQSERAYWQTFKLREQALQAQAERLQVEGSLVEAEIVNALIDRLASTLTTMLGQWPDWVLSLLPSGTLPKHRAEIRKAVASKVDELGILMADILAEWAEEQ